MTAADPLNLPVIKDRVRKREAIKGPREGDWVIMPDGSFARLTSNGIREFSSWVWPNKELPIDARPDPRNPNRVDHPQFVTDHVFEDLGGAGSFMLRRDGTISHSGGNDFHPVSRRARLIDTGQIKPGQFCAFQMNHPELDSEERFQATGKRGVEFELPCRVYRYEAAR